MIITKDEMIKARTVRGGYTKRQIEIAKKWTDNEFKKGWFKKLIGVNILDSEWLRFVAAKPKEKVKNVILNPLSKPSDWYWQPQKSDIPPVKIKSKNNKNREKNKQHRFEISSLENQEFYLSKEWLSLRVRVLEKYCCKCMMCGRSPKDHGIVIHVDHIKPRSKYPQLSLEFENLQLLCSDCNLGKSNKYETDWRPFF